VLERDAGASSVVELGPARGVAREAREQAVFELLSGEQRAESLAELASEPGESLDLELRDRLAPVEPTGPQGTVQVGAVTAPDTVENAARVAAGMRAAFRSCYRRALITTPDLAAIVRVAAEVDATGAVTSAKATPNAPLPASLIACMEARVRAALFFRSSRAEPVAVSFPVTLKPSE
jgi:hypothetical protein